MSANHELNLFEGGEKEKITDLLPYQKEDRLFFFMKAVHVTIERRNHPT
jgi:hypothetical protein